MKKLFKVEVVEDICASAEILVWAESEDEVNGVNASELFDGLPDEEWNKEGEGLRLMRITPQEEVGPKEEVWAWIDRGQFMDHEAGKREMKEQLELQKHVREMAKRQQALPGMESNNAGTD